MKLKAGEMVPLLLQLFDGVTTKYVRATVKDEAASAISGSPFTLTHEAAGLYKSTALLMPSDVEYIQAQYRVYDDAGFTTISTYADTTEAWSLNVEKNATQPNIEAKISTVSNIEAIVSGSKLTAVVEEDET